MTTPNRDDQFARMAVIYNYLLEHSHVVTAQDYFVLDVYDDQAKVRVWHGFYKNVADDLHISLGKVTTSFSHLVKMESIRLIAQGIWLIGDPPRRPLWDALQDRDMMSGRFRPTGRIEKIADGQHRQRNELEAIKLRLERLERVVYAKDNAIPDSRD